MRADFTAAPAIRTPDQRLRVFVSSTLDELAPERAAAREAITQLHLSPVLFELGARPYPPRELYRAYLAQSDIFIGIYWQRYGWVAPGMQISGLEDEYALATGKPKLIYIKMPAPERAPSLQSLLARIRSEDAASYQKFATAEELRERIANDLALLLTEHFTSTVQTSVAARPAPIPVPRSRLIDRHQESAQACSLLQSEEVGLVTLTGPGGVGKTRLAAHVAAELAPLFPDGAPFVSLASLKDPELVIPAMAQALGLALAATEPAGEQLMAYLRSHHVLLVLDNAEQLVAAAPLASQALEQAPELKLLVTSREPLRIRDERIVPVPPLELPDPAQLPDLEHLVEIPAIALFVERAREARPNFAITSENAPTIVEICRRLDGLPLAMELAAARLSLLTPEGLLQKLAHRLPLLTRGARDLPERQQTLRNTIAWSYDLLNEGEQQLFRRLAVFEGGFTLEAAQAVCNLEPTTPSTTEQTDDEDVVLEQLAQLLDKSLVQGQQASAGDPRFSMLETIGEYALEQLHASGEEAAVQERHANYFLQLAEQIEPHLFSPGVESWVARLESDEANFRAALEWSKMHKDMLEYGLRLAGALSFYWFMHGSPHEGRRWLEEFLTSTASSDRSVVRGKALIGVGMLAWTEGDFAAASPCLEEGLELGREAGNEMWIAYAGSLLGLVRLGQGNFTEARSLFEESYSLIKNLGDSWGQAVTLYHMGAGVYRSGDLATARKHFEESLRLFHQQGDVLYQLLVLCALQVLVSSQGDKELANSLNQQVLQIIQQASNREVLGLFLINTGEIWRFLGDMQQAQLLYKYGLSLWQGTQKVKQVIGMVKGLAGLAEIAANQGQAERAGRLFGAASHLLPSTVTYRESLKKRIDLARARLDTDRFEAGWSAGVAMTQEQAIDEALQ